MHTYFPHVTVATIVERDGRFLLVQEHTNDGIRWNQPAGHLEANESPQQGAIRETLEETGHLVTLQYFLGVYFTRTVDHVNPKTFLRLAFIGNSIDYDKERPLDEGIIRATWLTLDEMKQKKAEMRSPLVIQCVEDYLAGIRLDLKSVFDPYNDAL